MLTAFKLLVLASGVIVLLLDRHLVADPALPFDTFICHAINSLLGVCILIDLISLALLSLDPQLFAECLPNKLRRLDIAICLIWSCLNLSPWGLLTVLTDAAGRIFHRWAYSTLSTEHCPTFPHLRRHRTRRP